MRWRIPKYFPGWFVSGGGGSGSGTVQTDGVTIQGDGSAGNKIAIKAVQTDASLTGAGTVASPLKQPSAGFWAPLYTTRGGLGSSGAITQNQLIVTAWLIEMPILFGHFDYYCWTADNTANVYDLGLYNAAGTLVAAVGATAGTTFCPAAAETTLAVNASYSPPVLIPPGVYYFAFTSNAAAPAIRIGGQNVAAYFSSGAFGASVGGACPGSITPQSFQGFIANNFAMFVALKT